MKSGVEIELLTFAHKTLYFQLN